MVRTRMVVVTVLIAATGASAQFQRWEYKSPGFLFPRGTATLDNPMKFEFQIVENNAIASKQVSVAVAAQMFGELPSAASLRKATAIRDSVNATLGGNRASLLPAGFNRELVWTGQQWIWQVNQLWGIKVTDLASNDAKGKGAIKMLNDPTKQAGNGAGLNKMGGGAKPTSGSMSRSSSSSGPQSSGDTATGYDPQGGPSIATLGLWFEDLEGSAEPSYIASLPLNPGDSISYVLSELATRVNGFDFSELGWTGGPVAHYDSVTQSVVIDAAIRPDQIFFWGNTDTGLDFSAEVFIPEPATCALLAPVTGLFLRRKRRVAS